MRNLTATLHWLAVDFSILFDIYQTADFADYYISMKFSVREQMFLLIWMFLNRYFNKIVLHSCSLWRHWTNMVKIINRKLQSSCILYIHKRLVRRAHCISCRVGTPRIFFKYLKISTVLPPFWKFPIVENTFKSNKITYSKNIWGSELIDHPS